MEINDLVKSAVNGNDDAFYQLVSCKKDMLYRTAFSYVKNKEDALDIVSETAYRAYISLKKIKEPKYFYTYLQRILINTAIDFLRKKKDTAELKEDMLEDKAESESYIDLRNSLDSLSGDYKAIIIMKYFQDFTLKEVAEVLGCPLGTVKSKLHKALSILKLDLEEGYYE